MYEKFWFLRDQVGQQLNNSDIGEFDRFEVRRMIDLQTDWTCSEGLDLGGREIPTEVMHGRIVSRSHS